MPTSTRVLLALGVLCACAMAAAQAADCKPSQYQDSNGTCVDFASPYEKASTDHSAKLDTGNTAWILTSGALVMIMTPGVAFFYAGLAGEEMASNTMMMSFVSMALVSITFYLYGYSASFGMKIFGWFGFNDVNGTPSGVYGSGIPNIAWAFFETQFATITPALISGGIVGRMRFGAFIIFVVLWSSLVYIPLARWIWAMKLNENYEIAPLGWEAKMGALDFSGVTVIDVSSGFGALVAAIILGKRYNHGEPIKPHNVPLVMIGLTLVWFGWYGFNAGSAGAANEIASIAAQNTQLAASAGFLAWMALEWTIDGKVDPCGAASGAVAGLVCITPACGYVQPWASLIFGVVGTVVSFFMVQFKNKLRYDDTLDVFAIHGIAGFTGGILTGVFACKDVNPVGEGALYGNWIQLLHQLIANVVAAVYSTAMTFVILMALKHTIGIRVSEEKELQGVDMSYHGGAAYGENRSRGGTQSPIFKPANEPKGDFSSLTTPVPEQV